MQLGAWLFPLVLALPAGTLAAQDPAPVHGCRFCGGKGEIECKKHGAFLELERAVKQCSVAGECKTCLGALTTDCKICSEPTIEHRAEERRKLAADWRTAMRKKVDEVTGGKDILHCQTAHYDLTWSVRDLTVGKDKLDAHTLMHLHGKRLEELWAKFLEVFQVADRDFSARPQVYVFRDLEDHKRLAPRVAQGGGSGVSQKLMGAWSVFSCFHDQRTMPGDEGLHRTIVHNVTHLLLANLDPPFWVGNRKHGWVDEGVAHWFEDLLTGKCTNYCYEEVGIAIGAGFKNGRWRVPIRKLVEEKKLKTFTDLCQLNTDQLDWQDHGQAFASVDFLLQKYGGAAFTKFVRSLKKGEATRDALQSAFQFSILRFDEELAEWVKATYPLQEK